MDKKRIGHEGEVAAVEYLTRNGYQIRDRNVYCRVGELDVIAEKDHILCFVEVRTRSTAAFGAPALTVMSSKQARVVKAAMYYLQKNRITHQMIRFDVISVIGRGRQVTVDHILNAFDAGM